MTRPMKYHIYNEKHEPLCWDGKVLEFDTFTSAVKLFNDLEKEFDFPFENTVINEDILYYDGGYLNATNFTIKKDADGEPYLSPKD